MMSAICDRLEKVGKSIANRPKTLALVLVLVVPGPLLEELGNYLGRAESSVVQSGCQK